MALINDRNKKRAAKIYFSLKKHYPYVKIGPRSRSPFRTLVAVILSAQCTDKKVDAVLPGLFRKYKDVRGFACARRKEFEKDIRPIGLFRNKAKNIIGCAKALLARHGGKVPRTMEELTALPGVGRKSANVVLGHAFGVPGVIVDTHVIRLSRLIGLTRHTNPVKIEFDIRKLLPEKYWTHFSDLLVTHGRTVCVARRPRCPECPIRRLCDYGKKSLRAR